MSKKQTIRKLNGIHKSVPPDFYDSGIKNNIFQRYWHKKRFEALEAFLNNTSGNILDLGCHGGTLTNFVSTCAQNSKVYGLDISEKAIAYAQSKHPHIKFAVRDLDKGIPFEKEMFDAVTCLDILEHVFNPRSLVKEIKRVLKTSGSVIVEIPNETLLFKSIWFVWTRLRGKVWKDAHIHAFSIKDLEDLFEKNGFEKTGERKIHSKMLWIIKYRLKNRGAQQAKYFK